MTDELRQILDADQAAELLGIARRTLWRWAREGMVPHRRLGGRHFSFRRDELIAWHNAQPGKTVQEALDRIGGQR